MNKYYLSICATIRNEADYLEEFVEWHLIQGVQHFYFYEDGSCDNTLEIARNYEEIGIATVVHLDKTIGQMQCYEKYLKDFGEESKWTAFIDCDEFLVVCPERSIYRHNYDNLPEVICLFEDVYECSAIAVHWAIYGSNGELTYEPKLVTERFTRRAKHIDKHVKSIVRNADVESVGRNPHTFRMRGKVIDERGTELPLEYALQEEGTASILRINHYHTKSRDEYVRRKRTDNPGIASISTDKKMVEVFECHDVNDLYDPMPAKYINKILENLNERPWRK